MKKCTIKCSRLFQVFLRKVIGKRGKKILIVQGKGKQYDASTLLLEIAKEWQGSYATLIVAAKLNNVVKDLQVPVNNYQTIEFIDMTSELGMKIYRRSIGFLLITALHEVFSTAEIIVECSIKNALYCKVIFPDSTVIDAVKVELIEARMKQLVKNKLPIVRKTLNKEAAVQLFKKAQQIEKANLIASLQQKTVSIYYCGEFYDYLYGAMLPSTEHLDVFALDYYAEGIVLRTPMDDVPNEVPALSMQHKLANIFNEAERWAKILHCGYVTDLNRYNRIGGISDIIRVSEALHEKRIAQIADHITADKRLRIILIAGPSSSGKTTFAQRLRIQLRVNGIEPVSISLDDYFLNRLHTPRNERGEYDFEALAAVDINLFNEHMMKLLSGKAVTLPRYNFVTGERSWIGREPLQLGKDQPVIIEGIHGLNEKLTEMIPHEAKYKIYISPLTQLNIDAHNRIPTTDARLIRRMVRDHQSRGAYALKTLRQWPNVRAGEEKNIFPYQEEADVMFNSALIYELGILKKYAKPLLEKVSVDVEEYSEAVRLLDFLNYVHDIYNEDDIPNNSILREFIGKSCFL